MKRKEVSSVVCCGQFCAGEIEPGTFHESEEKVRLGQTTDSEAPKSGAATKTLDENGNAETEDDRSPEGDADEH